jgi:transcription elongation GreA/GreB family factor
VALAVGFGLAQVGCASGNVPETLGPQLEEARRLTEELHRQRDAANTELRIADASIEAFMARRVASESIDAPLVRVAMMECLTASVSDVEPTPAEPPSNAPAMCDTRSAAAIGAHLDSLEPSGRDHVEAQLRSVVTARNALKVGIPRRAAEVGRLCVETQARIIEMRETADTINTAAASNPSMEGGEFTAFREDYGELTRRIEELSILLDVVRHDLETTKTSVQERLETLAYAISVYGVE